MIFVHYPELTALFLAVIVASLLKLPFSYLIHRQWNWKLVFGTGGMPSSHSALITATTLTIGLFRGFDQPLFALALAISMIVIYDAAGVRRQAGIHAERINMIIREIFRGRPVQEQDLKEMLGHTPIEVLGGVIVGTLCALFLYLVLPQS
jgi:acid phosphatase family membrane protein YuiD